MAIQTATRQVPLRPSEAQLHRVEAEGTAAHSYYARLIAGTGLSLSRDLSDAVHLFCQLYGRHPGLVELSLQACAEGTARDWLRAASDSFERERLFLVRLTASVGPLPSTPGAAQTETALLAQRHALETLVGSERRGCALGAVTALVADWPAIRAVLDRAATRIGIEVPGSSMPDVASVAAAIDGGVDGLGPERALGFGGEQLLLQNRGLLDLIEARAEARDKADG